MLTHGAAELIKAELQKEGLDPALYGLHSLQAGGATTAAALGVPEHLFQRQGGWLLLVTRTLQDQTS